jgi:hypothetical protein
MNILNKNRTIKKIKNKIWWYNYFKTQSKFGISVRPEAYYFGIFSKKLINR